MPIHAVSVTDCFEIRPNMPHMDHVPGLVIIFDGRQCDFDLPGLGQTVTLVVPDGEVRHAVVAEIKEHGDGRSFFFPDLKKADGPVGSVASWPAKIQSTRERGVLSNTG